MRTRDQLGALVVSIIVLAFTRARYRFVLVDISVLRKEIRVIKVIGEDRTCNHRVRLGGILNTRCLQRNVLLRRKQSLERGALRKVAS